VAACPLRWPVCQDLPTHGTRDAWVVLSSVACSVAATQAAPGTDLALGAQVAAAGSALITALWLMSTGYQHYKHWGRPTSAQAQRADSGQPLERVGRYNKDPINVGPSSLASYPTVTPAVSATLARLQNMIQGAQEQDESDRGMILSAKSQRVSLASPGNTMRVADA
jgi:hypothetical protein